MTDQADDGGQAFPTHNTHSERDRDTGDDRVVTDIEPGRALRDYFAGQALVGLVSRVGMEAATNTVLTAVAAYRIADAMLKVRTNADV